MSRRVQIMGPSLSPPRRPRNLTGPAAYLGARPDVPGRADYLLFLTVSGIFLLGMLAFLRYSNLDPVRERLCHVAEPVAPGGRVATSPALEILG